MIFTTLLSLLKLTGPGTNLSISNLSTSVFKLAEFDFNAKLEVLTNFLYLPLLHNLKDQL